MENYNRKKREAEEEERKRLLKLVEHEYRYKSDTYDSANNTLTTPPTTTTTIKEQEYEQLKREHQPATRKSYEPLKDHSQETRHGDGGDDVGIEMTRRRGRSDTMNSVDGIDFDFSYV